MRRSKNNEKLSSKEAIESFSQQILHTNILSLPLPILIIYKDIHSRYILYDFNIHSQEIFNLPLERLKGKELRLFWDRETWDSLRKGLTKAIRKHEEAVIESIYIKKDEKEKCYRLTIWSFADNFACVCFIETIDKYIFTQSVLSEKLKYEELFKNTPVMMVMLDKQGKILDANSNWCEKTGYEKIELIGRTLIELFSDETRKNLSFEEFENKIISNELVEYPIQICRKDGQVLTCLSTARALFDINGSFIRCYFVANDISTLKELSEKYESNEKLLKTLFENVTSAIVLYSAQDGIVECNSQTENLLGYTKFNLLGKKLYEVITFDSEKKEKFKSIIDNINNEDDLEFAFSILKEGKKQFIELKSRRVYLKDKPISLVILLDKSKEKQKDLKIEESELMFQMLFEESSKPIKLHSRDGRVLMINKIGEHLFGDNINDDGYLNIKNKKFDYNKHLLDFIKSKDLTTDIEYSIKTKDGLKYLKERNKKLILGSSNSSIILSIVDDLTETREFEEEQKRIKKYLSQLNETKNKLVYILSHDLRAPTASIIGIANTILEEPKLTNEEITTYIKLIKSSATHQLDLINNLLDWSLLESGKFNYSFKPNYLSYAIYQSINSIHGLAKEKDIKVIVKVEPLYVLIDLNIFSRIIINILSNALKFSYPKSRIEVLSQLENNFSVKIIVRDYGIGFDEEVLGNLFTLPQRRSKTGTKGEKGTGLGLTLCNDMLKIFDSHLEIKSPINKNSKKNKGSEVSFNVPIVEPAIFISNSISKELIKNISASKFDNFLIINKDFKKYSKNLLKTYHLLIITNGNELNDSFIEEHKRKFKTLKNIIVVGDSEQLPECLATISSKDNLTDLIIKEIHKIEFDLQQQIGFVNQMKKMLRL